MGGGGEVDQAFSQMRVAEAEEQLDRFCRQLSAGPPSDWIQSAALAAAEAQLRQCGSYSEKLALLRLLMAGDFGDGGQAAVRFRARHLALQLQVQTLPRGEVPAGEVGGEELLQELVRRGKWEQARAWAGQLARGEGNGTASSAQSRVALAQVGSEPRV